MMAHHAVCSMFAQNLRVPDKMLCRCRSESFDVLQVRFSDDMTGIYVVNPDPEDTAENASSLLEAQWKNITTDDDDVIEEQEEEYEVFPDTQTTPMLAQGAEPETEVVAVADAFAKFRRLDQLIDEDDDVPRERKPVRKITPPREEPTLFERYQQMTASKTDTSVVTVSAEERALKTDAGPDMGVNGQAKTTVGAANQPRPPPGKTKDVNVTSTHHFDELDFKGTRQPSSRKHQEEAERPEPGTTRTLRTRWEMMDAGQTVPSETNRNNSLAPSIMFPGGNP